MTPEEQELILHYVAEEMSNNNFTYKYDFEILSRKSQNDDPILSLRHGNRIRWNIVVYEDHLMDTVTIYLFDYYNSQYRPPFDPCNEESITGAINIIINQMKNLGAHE